MDAMGDKRECNAPIRKKANDLRECQSNEQRQTQEQGKDTG
jgi:hypothetical protein